MGNIKYDNVDDRKEIYNILNNHLDEKNRRLFLEFACKKCNVPYNTSLRPGKGSTWDAKEVYWQLMSLSFMHKLDLDWATKQLTEIAKKGKINYEM